MYALLHPLQTLDFFPLLLHIKVAKIHLYVKGNEEKKSFSIHLLDFQCPSVLCFFFILSFLQEILFHQRYGHFRKETGLLLGRMTLWLVRKPVTRRGGVDPHQQYLELSQPQQSSLNTAPGSSKTNQMDERFIR